MMILFYAGLAHALDHHVVREGETLARVAADEGVPVAALRALNRIPAREEAPVGTVLLLPGEDGNATAAVVLTVMGPSTATLPGERAVPLAQTHALPAGTLVCTEASSYATLRLATSTKTRGHDEITLLGGTCLTLDSSWSRDTDHASLVSMRRGSVSVRAATDGGGAVTVRTDAGVSTSESGGFRVTVEEGASRTEAIDGPVAVMGAGEEVELPTGYATRVRKGEAPLAALRLLAPGVPVRPSERDPLRRPDFEWTPVDRALGYRLEISRTEDFSDIVMAESVGAPPWLPETLFLPFNGTGLWWRVASFDRTGFLGPPSEPRRIALPAGMGQ
ncbi:MAG: LysM peptidoglycan-binding domain-containing protein [Pseudomonadota bacterium]|nr:LysM peptidoglycan-binding domain-containing protein [Pseudomonadota bacterium]